MTVQNRELPGGPDGVEKRLRIVECHMAVIRRRAYREIHRRFVFGAIIHVHEQGESDIGLGEVKSNYL